MEVMAAVMIISIALLAVYRLHGQSAMMGVDAQFFTVAPQLAQQALANTMLELSQDTFGDSGDFGDEFPGYTWRVDIEEVENEYLETVAESLKRIDVTVTLEDQLSYEFRTYKMVMDESE